MGTMLHTKNVNWFYVIELQLVLQSIVCNTVSVAVAATERTRVHVRKCMYAVSYTHLDVYKRQGL